MWNSRNYTEKALTLRNFSFRKIQTVKSLCSKPSAHLLQHSTCNAGENCSKLDVQCSIIIGVTRERRKLKRERNETKRKAIENGTHNFFFSFYLYSNSSHVLRIHFCARCSFFRLECESISPFFLKISDGFLSSRVLLMFAFSLLRLLHLKWVHPFLYDIYYTDDLQYLLF